MVVNAVRVLLFVIVGPGRVIVDVSNTEVVVIVVLMKPEEVQVPCVHLVRVVVLVLGSPVTRNTTPVGANVVLERTVCVLLRVTSGLGKVVVVNTEVEVVVVLVRSDIVHVPCRQRVVVVVLVRGVTAATTKAAAAVALAVHELCKHRVVVVVLVSGAASAPAKTSVMSRNECMTRVSSRDQACSISTIFENNGSDCDDNEMWRLTRKSPRNMTTQRTRLVVQG